MAASGTLLEHDWLGACHRATDELRRILAAADTVAARVEETGETGGGGDRTLVIDADAESAVFAQLDLLHEAGARFTAISEERGYVDYGTDGKPPFVVIDPIDGSMNAKRGLTHHAISVAVSDGPTMGDVVFGFVHDFGPGETWHAIRGQGAFLDGKPLGEAPPERRRDDGRLELVAVESARPQYFADTSEALIAHVHRVRSIGSIAIALCQLAETRVDGMVALWRTRAVDAAAAQLVVRESGGLVAFTTDAGADPLAGPLDLDSRLPLCAARSLEALGRLQQVPMS